MWIWRNDPGCFKTSARGDILGWDVYTPSQKLPSFIALVTPDFRMWAFLQTFTLHPDQRGSQNTTKLNQHYRLP